MLAKENLQKKISPITQNENIDGEFFTNEEWKYFKDEINKQVAQGEKIIDFGKAGRNARYLARLDEAFSNISAGRWTEHELIEVGDDE